MSDINTPPTVSSQTPMAQTTFQQPQMGVKVIPDDVVGELNSKANKYGMRYSTIEEMYLEINKRPDIQRMNEVQRRKYSFQMLDANCVVFASNPLITYEVFITGIVVNHQWKTSWIIGKSCIPGKDPEDICKNWGVPTVITNRDNYEIVETLQPLTFVRANLSQSEPGVAKRELLSSRFTKWDYLNRVDVTVEQIESFKKKEIPEVTLAQLKSMPSGRTLKNPKEGGTDWQDRSDIKRMTVTVKNTSSGHRRSDQAPFYLWTVIDDSLPESEKVDIKGADGKVITYGGVSISPPKHVFEQLNLDMGSIIEVFFNFRRSPSKDGTKEFVNTEVIAAFPIVHVQKKKPVAQTPSAQKQGVTTVDLTSMA